MKKKYSLGSVLTLMFFTSAVTCLILCILFLFLLRGEKEPAGYDRQNYGIDEILGVISERFIGQYDEDELIIEAKRAIIDALDDRWSYYLTAEEFESYMQTSDNTYRGIGVEVLIDEEAGGIKVVNVYENSGARSAGIIPGDIITAIDGTSIRGYTMNDIRAALRRQLGDTALLTVLRAGGEYHDLTVVYNVIFTDPVSYEMLDGNIGYIKLRNFDGGSADSFIAAAQELIGQDAAGFIFDVRSNNGGRVNEMTKILDFLLPEGIIFISVNELGEESIITSDAAHIGLPAVVLVNEHSYSGAEYFTATLSEYGYALTVGEQTTGKNRMQATLRLSDGSAVHISTGMFLTPNRIDLVETGGYTPDYVIEFSEEELILYYTGELTFDIDPQLRKALSLLSDK